MATGAEVLVFCFLTGRRESWWRQFDVGFEVVGLKRQLALRWHVPAVTVVAMICPIRLALADETQ